MVNIKYTPNKQHIAVIMAPNPIATALANTINVSVVTDSRYNMAPSIPSAADATITIANIIFGTKLIPYLLVHQSINKIKHWGDCLISPYVYIICLYYIKVNSFLKKCKIFTLHC